MCTAHLVYVLRRLRVHHIHFSCGCQESLGHSGISNDIIHELVFHGKAALMPAQNETHLPFHLKGNINFFGK